METNDKTPEYIQQFLDTDYENLKKNLQQLLKEYDRKSKRLDKIIKHSDKQQQTLMKLNIELDEYKNDLEKKVQEEIEKRKEHEKMLMQQSKLASMGEMMDAVAHQWKQPINAITMLIYMLSYDLEDDLINEEYIKTLQDKIFNHIAHMTDTLDEFRSFFRPNKRQEEFNIRAMIEKVLLLVKDEFIGHKIEISIEERENFTLLGIENEFKHLILNIINNSKDAFNEKKIQNREIKITISHIDNIKMIEIEDNAGGIPPEILPNIFKANFTTKEDGKGTGIGLYMSMQIAEKYHGILSAENIENGVKFIFKKIEGVKN